MPRSLILVKCKSWLQQSWSWFKYYGTVIRGSLVMLGTIVIVAAIYTLDSGWTIAGVFLFSAGISPDLAKWLVGKRWSNRG